jgi:hypothetical protein
LGLLGGALTQGTSILQPTIITETLGSFTGTAVNYIDGQNQGGSFGLENYSGSSIFLIIKRNTLGTGNWTINLAGGAGLCMLVGTSNIEILKTPSGNQADPPIPFGDPILIASSGQSDTFFSATFNDDFGTTNAVSFVDVSDNLGMGSDTGQTGNDTSIFEFLIYNRLLNSSEYAQVVNYLKTKYQYSTW